MGIREMNHRSIYWPLATATIVVADLCCYRCGSFNPGLLKSSTNLLSASFIVKIDMRIIEHFDSRMLVSTMNFSQRETLVLISQNLSH